MEKELIETSKIAMEKESRATSQNERKRLKRQGISHKDEKTYATWKKVHDLIEKSKGAMTVEAMAKELHMSPVTFRRYRIMKKPPVGTELGDRFHEVVEYKKAHPDATIDEIKDVMGLERELVKRYLSGNYVPPTAASMVEEDQMVAHIKSISTDVGEILRNILRLHVKAETFDCDLTYGEGNFYSKTGIPKPGQKYDKHPSRRHRDIEDLQELEGVKEFGQMYNSLIIDLPEYIADNPFQEGNTYNPNPDKTAFESPEDLYEQYAQMMRMGYQMLYPGGIMVFTSTDVPMEDRMVWASHDAQAIAADLGFELVDTFILNKTAEMKKVRKKMAQHSARVACTYYFVFRKPLEVKKHSYQNEFPISFVDGKIKYYRWDERRGIPLLRGRDIPYLCEYGEDLLVGYDYTFIEDKGRKELYINFSVMEPFKFTFKHKMALPPYTTVEACRKIAMEKATEDIRQLDRNINKLSENHSVYLRIRDRILKYVDKVYPGRPKGCFDWSIDALMAEEFPGDDPQTGRPNWESHSYPSARYFLDLVQINPDSKD